jgi:glutamate carboxypeptidase
MTALRRAAGGPAFAGPALVRRLGEQRTQMLQALGALVSVESPSDDLDATRRCAERAVAIARDVVGGEPRLIESAGRVHVHWAGGGTPRVALLGHLDTVWPMGTLAERPFAVSGDRALGPGVFDMKAGAVQALFAIAALDDRAGVELLLTTDEEIGSPTSRELVEDLARRVDAVLVLEPSQDGALKTARKGVAQYRIDVAGRAAHAGLEPERGVNALGEMARIAVLAAELSRPESGTTVTPTMASGGTAANVVPAHASLVLDVRTSTAEEQERVDGAIRAIRPVHRDAAVVVTGGPNRPPMPAAAAQTLFETAGRSAAALGLPPLRGVAVGGGSDGNFTAGIGTATLDGLGAVGDGAHAAHEHVIIDAMPERAALVAAMLHELSAQR